MNRYVLIVGGVICFALSMVYHASGQDDWMSASTVPEGLTDAQMANEIIAGQFGVASIVLCVMGVAVRDPKKFVVKKEDESV